MQMHHFHSAKLSEVDTETQQNYSIKNWKPNVVNLLEKKHNDKFLWTPLIIHAPWLAVTWIVQE